MFVTWQNRKEVNPNKKFYQSVKSEQEANKLIAKIEARQEYNPVTKTFDKLYKNVKIEY